MPYSPRRRRATNLETSPGPTACFHRFTSPAVAQHIRDPRGPCRRIDVNLHPPLPGFELAFATGLIDRVSRVLDIFAIDGHRIDIHGTAEQLQNVLAYDNFVSELLPRRFAPFIMNAAFQSTRPR